MNSDIITYDEYLLDPSISVEDLAAIASVDVGFYGKWLLPHLFTTPFYKKTHGVTIERLNNNDLNFGGTVNYRGMGKSTLLAAKFCQIITNREYHHLLWTSKTHAAAMKWTNSIKFWLKTTPEIVKLFGDIQISDITIEKVEEFANVGWVAYDETLVLPRGVDQQHRGLNWRGYRPDFIALEDLEEKSELNNPEIRAKIKAFWVDDISECIPQHHKNWRFWLSDTLKHEDSLTADFMFDPDWDVGIGPVCDSDYNTNVPLIISQVELDAKIRKARDNGTLDSFAREFMCLPQATEDIAFDPAFFQYYERNSLEFIKNLPDCISIMLVDPARTLKATSADSCIFVWTIDLERGKMYVRDYYAGKLYPDQLFDKVTAWGHKYSCVIVGVDFNGLHEYIEQPLKNAMVKARSVFKLIELKPRYGEGGRGTGKLKHIAQLVSYYRNKFIWHFKEAKSRLEEQLTNFPMGKLVDIIDSAAHIIQVMEKEHLYFDTEADPLFNVEDPFEFENSNAQTFTDSFESNYIRSM